jgi:GT2 family glycosyltransferase
VAAHAGVVRHVPDVLHHVQSERKDEAADGAARRALEGHLRDAGRDAVVEEAGPPGTFRPRFRVRGRPLVSVVIPTAFAAKRAGRATTCLVVECVRSIRQRSTWADFEVLVVADRQAPEGVSEALGRLGAEVLPFPGPFNFAASVNAGAAAARGIHLLLLNDDTEVISPDWLQRLLEHSQQPQVGAVGATLLFPNGRLQHAGIHLLGGKALHAFYGYPPDHPGYREHFGGPRNCCAVTGACLMTRREVFEEAGGLSPAFPLDYNDVDYCLRLLRTGRRVVCTPFARLYHHEAFSRRGGGTQGLAAFRARWGDAAGRDPYYNPNFSTRFPDYRIAPGAG